MFFEVIRAIWILLAVIVLFMTLYSFDGKPNSDIGIFLAGSMLTLAFPISFLVVLLFVGVSIAVEQLFSVVSQTSYLSILVSWACLFTAGYWQWFVLLPWLWRKWKARRAAGITASP